MTPEGAPFMLGATVTNIISLTENQGVRLHLDTEDGELLAAMRGVAVWGGGAPPGQERRARRLGGRKSRTERGRLRS